MNALEKLKLSKELRGLLGGMDGLKAMEKLKAAKRVRELVSLLGGGAGQAGGDSQSEPEYIAKPSSPLYQSIIDGAEINVSLIEQVIEEANKNGDDETNGQLVQAVDVIKAWAVEQGMPDERFDSLFDSLYNEDYEPVYYPESLLLVDGL